MNEGCSGGWGIFNGFFAENAGLVTQDCAPYHAHVNDNECASFKMCKSVARVSKTYMLEDSSV